MELVARRAVEHLGLVSGVVSHIRLNLAIYYKFDHTIHRKHSYTLLVVISMTLSIGSGYTPHISHSFRKDFESSYKVNFRLRPLAVGPLSQFCLRDTHIDSSTHLSCTMFLRRYL